MPIHSSPINLNIDPDQLIQPNGSRQDKVNDMDIGSIVQLVPSTSSNSSYYDEDELSRQCHSSPSQSNHINGIGDEVNEDSSREGRLARFKDIRSSRMKLLSTNETIPLDCDRSSLGPYLKKIFRVLTAKPDSKSVTIYQTVLNSLFIYFQGKEDESSTLEKTIADFLRGEFIMTQEEARLTMEDESRTLNDVMSDVEATVLLELFCVLHSPKDAVQMNILKKLRYIYISNAAQALRNFLKMAIIDCYMDTLPMYISELFDECGIEMPFDLKERIEEIKNEENKIMNGSYIVSPNHSIINEDKKKEEEDEDDEEMKIEDKKRKMKKKEKYNRSSPIPPSNISNRLDALLEEVNEEDQSIDGIKGGNESIKSQSQSISMKRKTIPSTPTREVKKSRDRRVFVPETPDEKMKREDEEDGGRITRRRSSIKNDINIVVKQTPMEKMLRAKRAVKADKLANLVKSASNSPSLTGGSSIIRSRIRDGKDERRTSLRSATANLFNKDSRDSTSREEFLSANREKEKKSRVAINLSTKFTESKSKKKKRDNMIESLTLDSDAVSSYKRRMKEVAAEGKNGDPSEIFYGRHSNRVGLFSEIEEKKQAQEKVKVYNRSGRIVYSSSSCYAAHTLLNAHNATPLVPSRPLNSRSSFKLSRLVRIAGKCDRIKLKKLRDRVLSPKKEPKSSPSRSSNQ